MASHPIVHVEFSAKNREQAGEFYEKLFDWKIVQMPDMNYASFDPGEGPGGGFNPASATNPAGTVLVYVGTDDIDASLAKVKELGGEIVLEKTEIADTGWFGIFTDPTGNRVGLYTPFPNR